MNLYEVTLTATAKRKISLLAKSAAEAEMNALDIYLNTDLLDIEPQTMIISDVSAEEVARLKKTDVCKSKCSDCPKEIQTVCAFSDCRARKDGDT